MIELQQCCREFQVGGEVVRALQDVDLRIAPGDYLSLMGPSGSGKSTLLNVLGLLDRPSRGRHFMDGREVGTLADTARALLRRERIGFVFQSFHLVPRLSTAQNVGLPLWIAGLPRKERQLRVQDPEGTQIDWWQRLTRPSWATYATVIGLLDGHKMLQGYLSAETDAGTHEHNAAKEPHQQRLTRRPTWTNAETEWAALIALALRISGVDSTDEYDDIVVALRDVGRQLRHSQHEVPPIESASISQYGA